MKSNVVAFIHEDKAVHPRANVTPREDPTGLRWFPNAHGTDNLADLPIPPVLDDILEYEAFVYAQGGYNRAMTFAAFLLCRLRMKT